MSKLKMIVNVLLAVTILFCLHPINSPIAGDCGDKGAGTPTITGNNNYPEDWIAEFQFDPSNPEEIDPNNSLHLNIIGGCSPYTWSVSGTDFWLDSDKTITTLVTNNTSVTIYTGASNCGSATITVTGCGGTEVTGYVRSTTGHWESWDTHQECVVFQASELSCDGYISGNKKYKVWITKYNCRTLGYCPNPGCDIAWPGYMDCTIAGMPYPPDCSGDDCYYYAAGEVTYGLWVCW